MLDLNHKYPKGFKKKLAEYYGRMGCVLCFSTKNLSIHHYYNDEKRISPYKLEKNEGSERIATFSDLKQFVLLCGSCHGKVHTMRNWWNSKDEINRPPLLNLLDKIVYGDIALTTLKKQHDKEIEELKFELKICKFIDKNLDKGKKVYTSDILDYVYEILSTSEWCPIKLKQLIRKEYQKQISILKKEIKELKNKR